ncbi:MAG TPA: polymer-forming cytoskeletal protein [Gemmatimonadota bacterium]|nr:polymer-forming cytoskeletal protein [Gemmatimonadota bacterium]
MAIWKESLPTKQEPAPSSPEPVRAIDRPEPGPSQSAPVAARPTTPASMESVIAAALTIEGKIEGAGHVRLVGKFKGDVHVDGDLTIEPGAKVTGSVRAGTVVIGGELEGNIESASTVKLLETGVLNGDLKAGSLTVASGSRMRGQADFGWDEKETRVAPRMRVETGSNP